MSIRVITAGEAMQVAAETLGMGSAGFRLSSPEGIAASVRRAASFLCPATQRQLADAVLDAVVPLTVPEPVTREQVNSAVEALVLNGDLVEAIADEGQRLLFLGSPSFVERTADSCFVIGIRPFGERLIRSDELLSLEYHRHTRLCLSNEGPAKAALKDEGLREISARKWAAVPDSKDARAVLKDAMAQRRSAGSGIPGLTVIDRTKPVRYYKGRWREPQPHDDGIFIGRRPQEFGPPLWCAVEIRDGQPLHMVDLPAVDVAQPGCDEAWRLQAALDSLDRHPQVFLARSAGDGVSIILDCFSPVPSWAERYLMLKGDSVDESAGALFSYRLHESVVAEATNLLAEKLWMSPVEGEAS